MRNILTILTVCVFAACNTGDGSQSEKMHAVETEMLHKHEGNAIAKLTLNGKLKWKVDAATGENIKALQVIAEVFSKKNNAVLDDFHTVADELQSGLDKVMKECRMKGADHDALHHLLEPLLIEVKDLKAVMHISAANKSFEKIHQQLTVYNHYFE